MLSKVTTFSTTSKSYFTFKLLPMIEKWNNLTLKNILKRCPFFSW